MRVLALTLGATLAVDQGSKAVMLHVLDLPGRGEMEVLPPFLVFRMGWNRGINFGLLSGDAEAMRWALVAVAVVVSALVARWAWAERDRAWMQAAAGLLIGGALGNAFDRVVHGAVVDFLNMSCCGIGNPYVFNLADVGVFAGALGLAALGGARSEPEGKPAARRSRTGRRQ